MRVQFSSSAAAVRRTSWRQLLELRPVSSGAGDRIQIETSRHEVFLEHFESQEVFIARKVEWTGGARRNEPSTRNCERIRKLCTISIGRLANQANKDDEIPQASAKDLSQLTVH